MFCFDGEPLRLAERYSSLYQSRFAVLVPFALAGGFFLERADGLPLKNSRLVADLRRLLSVCFPFYGGLIVVSLLITFLLLDMISIFSRAERGGESGSE